MKRAVLQAFMISGERGRLLALAKSEPDPPCAATPSSSWG